MWPDSNPEALQANTGEEHKGITHTAKIEIGQVEVNRNYPSSLVLNVAQTSNFSESAELDGAD